MIDRVLLDDETFRVTLGLLGGMKVTLKDRGLTRPAPPACAQHFKQTTDALQEMGVEIAPGSEPFEELLEEFAEAIFASSEGPRWALLFGTPPDQVAKRLAGET